MPRGIGSRVKVKAGIIGDQDQSQQDNLKNDDGKADDDAMKTQMKI